MKSEQLSEIKERWSKGTPGPWRWHSENNLEGGSRWEHSTTPDDVIYIDHVQGGDSSSCRLDLEIEPEDRDKIAHAPNDIEKLIEEIESLRIKVSEISELLPSLLDCEHIQFGKDAAICETCKVTNLIKECSND